MFRDGLINQVVIHASLCNKNLFVVQRYLKRFYNVKVSINALKRRKRYLWLSGKVHKVTTKIFNKKWSSTFSSHEL